MDQGERPEQWARLWAAVKPHAVEAGELGEYAVVLLERGPEDAGRAFPATAAHLREGCDECRADLVELARLLPEKEPGQALAPAAPPLLTTRPAPRAPLGAPRPVFAGVAAVLVILAAVGLVFAVGRSVAPAILVLSLGGAAVVLVFLVVTGNSVAAPSPVLAGRRQPLTISRRGFLVGIVAVWFVGTAGLYALPPSPRVAVLVVEETGLRSWVAEVIRRDAALSAMDWRIVGPEGLGAGSSDEQLWLMLDRSPERQNRPGAAVARSPYVAVAWEQSAGRLGLDRRGEVDWAAVQRVVADPNGPRFVVPLPGSPLGDDALLLLALAYQGPTATTFDVNPGEVANLDAWLRPFYQRQTRLRAAERIQIDDWARYRTALGEAGLLPEHVALALLPVLEPQARLQLRYPAVNVTRTYALGAAGATGSGSAYDRLRAALLSAQAQQSLASHGFRPVVDTPSPADGPFVTYQARGADWSVRWAEAARTETFDSWARRWQP